MGYPTYDLTFEQLQNQVGEWSRKNFPKNTPIDPFLGVVEEVGELSHSILKELQGIRGTTDEHKLKKIDAVADIIIYLADYCERNEIDMQRAVQITWAMVQRRDWQKNKKDGVNQ